MDILRFYISTFLHFYISTFIHFYISLCVSVRFRGVVPPEWPCKSFCPSMSEQSRAEPSRSNGQCVRYSNLPDGCTQKRASRVRETHTFKKLHFPASVSSARDAHFQNQVSSRLRKTLLFLKKNAVSSTRNHHFGRQH